MRFYFHEDAEAEFDRVVKYYEDSRPGLGMEFTQEVYATITRVIQFPDAWSPMSGQPIPLWHHLSGEVWLRSHCRGCRSSKTPKLLAG